MMIIFDGILATTGGLLIVMDKEYNAKFSAISKRFQEAIGHDVA